MSRPPVSVADLRQMIAARFPSKMGKPAGFIPTGVQAIDEALGGGLPIGRLTELVAPIPGCGGQSVIVRMLRSTREHQQRVALVDGSDSFSADDLPADAMRHLVWVRCANWDQTIAAADLLVRDGNYAVVVLDLCGCADRVLRRVPSTVWHRLHLATRAGGAVLVKTTQPIVPAVPWRIVLRESLSLGERLRPQTELVGEIRVDLDRGHTTAAMEMAG